MVSSRSGATYTTWAACTDAAWRWAGAAERAANGTAMSAPRARMLAGFFHVDMIPRCCNGARYGRFPGFADLIRVTISDGTVTVGDVGDSEAV